MVKGINNAFDHLELCLVLQAAEVLHQSRLLLPSHQSATKLPGSNFLPPTFSTGGKWDFQVANLLLATVNF